ncbi:hypothetical protein CBR_g23983 [Chara braunii]|uniref:assimilatory sulfite reductase (ferredoxin) n=1 Tax=Chara braunii TaxID=69332 RepID=A0A388L5L0_CHABU|nr:hypothetical protein CBR_g23983 [Chara braunii]|eukprot:GBG77538.1 hypothetical protein CBR_g23983 [Chara braunii]
MLCLNWLGSTRRLDSPQLDSARVDSARVDFARVDFTRVDSARADSARADSARVDFARFDSARFDSAHVDSVLLDSPLLESAHGSNRLGSNRLGSVRVSSARLGSTQLGSARLSSAQLVDWAHYKWQIYNAAGDVNSFLKYDHISANAVRIKHQPKTPPTTGPAKRNKVEIYKENSGFLRHPLIEEMQTEAKGINDAAAQIIKFHGTYLQDNREERTFGGEKPYQFMIRTKQPAGKVTNSVYLLMDKLADEFGIGTLRLTTRQTFQLHGILKKDLKTVLSTIIRNFGSTIGTCGDLNRNTLAPPAPFKNDPAYLYAQEYAEKIATLLAPQAGSYYEVWVDDEKFMSAEMARETEDVKIARADNSHGTNFEGSLEPIYGTQFLPRKFKIAVTAPGDNSVDILTNDIGLVTITDENGQLQGFDIFVGGGMGRTHRNSATFPLLAQPLGFVAKDDVLYAVKAIVATQRDYGRRDDRRQARMKYLVNEWGIDKFRTVVEQYFGKPLEPFKELPPWEFRHYLGWHEQGDGLLFLGVHVENGRVKGDAKKALRDVIAEFDIPIRLMANQNIILCDIQPSWKSKIQLTLSEAGLVEPQDVDDLNLTAMACPALPLCPLAVTEAERVMPDTLKRVRTVLNKVGLRNPSDAMVIRMTGCPNGCTRPYMAELAFVGDGPSSYQVYLGGSRNQTRLAKLFMDKMKAQNLETTLEPVFYMYKTQRLTGDGEPETFGDFADRVGFEAIHSYMAGYGGME